MEAIDRILSDFRAAVETAGRSGADSVYLNNAYFLIRSHEFSCPADCDLDGASADLLWFLECEKERRVVPHPAPDASFWRKTWGDDALPYGASWRLQELVDSIRDEKSWRRAVLFNYHHPTQPPCILCYQFMPRDLTVLDLTVTMRSSDVVNVLPQDVMMAWMLLRHVCNLTSKEIGDIHFNIANAHVFWEDMDRVEEFIREY